MNYRFILAGLITIAAQATLNASTLYDFGSATNIALANETTAYQVTGTNGTWTEDVNPNTSTTTQQIVCVVALTNTTSTPSCGSPKTGNAQDIPVTPPTGTLPTCTTNCGYMLVDGDPQYGAPVSISLNLISGDTYSVSFYQASSEELGEANMIAYNDSWQVYLLPTGTAATYICPQAYCANNEKTVAAPTGSVQINSSNVVVMDNPAGGSTGWEQETYSFTATSTGTQILEFVTNVTNSNGTAVTTAFVPPMLALADVTLTQTGSATPEPSTWGLMLLGGGLILLGSRLRRRSPAAAKE